MLARLIHPGWQLNTIEYTILLRVDGTCSTLGGQLLNWGQNFGVLNMPFPDLRLHLSAHPFASGSIAPVTWLQGIGPFYSSITTLEHPIPIDKIEASSNCGVEARPYFEIFENDSNRYIITSGIPNHAAECGQIYPNPNVRCKFKLLEEFSKTNQKRLS